MAEIFTLTLLVIKWLIAIILGTFTIFIVCCIGTACVVSIIDYFLYNREEKYLE